MKRELEKQRSCDALERQLEINNVIIIIMDIN